MKNIYRSMLALLFMMSCMLYMNESISAEDNGYVTYSAGDNITAYLYDDGRMEFKGTGKTDVWREDTVPWHDVKTNIVEVSFEEGITEIGSYAFYKCTELTKVELPDSIGTIRSYVFGNCEKLCDIELSENLKVLYGGAFQNCISLRKMKIPTKLKYIYGSNEKLGPFTGCVDLQINLDENATIVPEYLFVNMKNLYSVELPDSITTIDEYAFYGCENLENVDLPSNIEVIGDYAFGKCSSIKQLEFPSSLTSINEGAFIECTGLTDLYIPSNVIGLGSYAFYDCTNIEKISLEEGLLALRIATFGNCKKITEIKIPSTTKLQGYSTAEGVFDGCENLRKLEFAEGSSTVLYSIARGCENLEEVILPDTITKIEDKAFYDCVSLENITLPENVYEIESEAFYNCTSLNAIDLPKEIRVIGDKAFYNCSEIKEIQMSDKVEEVGSYAFGYCEKLSKVRLGKGIKHLLEGTFIGTAIEEIYLPYTLVQIDSKVFSDCTGLKDIYVPFGVTSIVEDAFNQELVDFHCYNGSFASQYAISKNYEVSEGISFSDGNIDMPDIVRIEYEDSCQLTFESDNIYFTDPVLWSVENNQIADISEANENSVATTIEGKGIGYTTVKLTIGNLQYASELYVGKLVESVDIEASTLTFYDKKPIKPDAKIYPEDATNKKIIWSSMDENIAVIDADGNVTPVSNGYTRIVAMSEDGGYYDMCYVQVEMNIKVTGITLNYSDYNFVKGEYASIVATVFPYDASIKDVLWSSSDENVVTVNNGVINAVNDGRAIIIATTVDGEYTASCFVTVNLNGKYATEVILDKESIYLEQVGETVLLNTQVVPITALNSEIQWTSSDEEVVKVDSNGKIIVIGYGTAIITAKISGTDIISQCTINVSQKNLSDKSEDDRKSETQNSNNVYIDNDKKTESPVSGDANSGNDVKSNYLNYNVQNKEKPELNKKNETSTGNVVIYKGIKYKISISKNGNYNATVAGISAKKKKANIADYVPYNGKKIKVTKIASNAFKTNKKLSKVVIGANIKKIGKKAFYKCSKLSGIVIKSKKLTVIHKKSFYGISKSAVFSVPRSKKKKYTKLLNEKAGFNVVTMSINKAT